MAIASMQKVMIVAHRSQASELLTALQKAGIVQILDAERAMVSKEWPELVVEGKRRREISESVDRLGKAVDFLKPYAGKDNTSLFAPYIEVDAPTYHRIVSEKDPLALLSQTESIGSRMEKLTAEADSRRALLGKLMPWQSLSVPVEQLDSLSTTVVFAGLIHDQQIQAVRDKLDELGAVYHKVADSNNTQACIIAVFNEASADVQKVLRAAEFEAAAFEGLTGTVAENISQIQSRLAAIQQEQLALQKSAAELAAKKLHLQVLFDHYQNLNGRMTTESTAPATSHVVFFEGWVMKNDYARLESVIAPFDACAVAPVQPGQDEEVPVEIDNGGSVKPYEVITRLYGMPSTADVDPTVFLAPFFTLFFGLCMMDAAYGIIMVGFFWWLLRKIKGDTRFMKMMLFCSVATIGAGAITGSWFGDAIQQFVPQLASFRASILVFDPLESPMYFFVLSLGLGYLQIIAGIVVAFVHKLRKGLVKEAVFDHGSWLVWLNSLLVIGLVKAGYLPAVLGSIFMVVAAVPALMIVGFSEREGGWGNRIGMGIYNLFSTVFYIGDVLSYIRLMALGMVGGGFGMAINEITKQTMDIPYVGWLIGGLIFIGGHVFNIANSALSAFVHSMRLQFVEFFTKFISGSGKEFVPLRQSFRYINVKK
jgi:V/A-type H+-transporting ATPase subunit I